jgi:hypothetical protein
MLHTRASFVLCDTFTFVFLTQHESSQNFTFNLFLCGTCICVFHTHLSPQENVYVKAHRLANQIERHYLLLRFEMHAKNIYKQVVGFNLKSHTNDGEPEL